MNSPTTDCYKAVLLLWFLFAHFISNCPYVHFRLNVSHSYFYFLEMTVVFDCVTFIMICTLLCLDNSALYMYKNQWSSRSAQLLPLNILTKMPLPYCWLNISNHLITVRISVLFNKGLNTAWINVASIKVTKVTLLGNGKSYLVKCLNVSFAASNQSALLPFLGSVLSFLFSITK